MDAGIVCKTGAGGKGFVDNWVQVGFNTLHIITSLHLTKFSFYRMALSRPYLTRQCLGKRGSPNDYLW